MASTDNPQSAVEGAVIGLCLADPKNLGAAIAAGIHPGSFDDSNLAGAFATLVDEDKAGQPLSLVALSIRHPRLSSLLGTCANAAPIGSEPGAYFAELKAQYWRRRTVHTLRRVVNVVEGREPWADLSGFRAEVERAMHTLLETEAGGRGPVPIARCLEETLPEIERAMEERQAGRLPGIPTGFAALDKLIGGGFAPGTVNVIAARTGRGKTTLALNLLHTAAQHGARCAYFTVEMTRHEITRKLLSLNAAVSSARIRIGDLSSDQAQAISGAASDLGGRTIWVDDSTGASLEAFEHACRALKRRGGLDLAVIDYVQQFSPEGRFHTTHERITEVSRRLKQLALELKVTVIGLAQLNRQAETSDAQPDIWHIKDSGAIEQDADLIVLIHAEVDTVRLFVGKNRHGPDRRHIPVESRLVINRFVDLPVNLEAFQ